VRAEQACVAEETFSVVRHDVRNKLAAARQAAAYLEAKSRKMPTWGEDPRFERFFAMIQSQLELAETMMAEHPAFHRVYAPNKVRTATAAIIDAACAATSAGPALVVSRGTVEPRDVLVDGPEVALALRCLIENGADANGDLGEVTVSGRCMGDDYAFVVTDQGAGISDERFRALVRPFETTHEGARGLGLSIARRVAQRHDGVLRLAPTERGARVELVIGAQAGGVE